MPLLRPHPPPGAARLSGYPSPVSGDSRGELPPGRYVRLARDESAALEAILVMLTRDDPLRQRSAEEALWASPASVDT